MVIRVIRGRVVCGALAEGGVRGECGEDNRGGEEDGERARVVADTRRREPRPLTLDGDVGALRKDGIEMRGNGDESAAAVVI